MYVRLAPLARRHPGSCCRSRLAVEQTLACLHPLFQVFAPPAVVGKAVCMYLCVGVVLSGDVLVRTACRPRVVVLGPLVCRTTVDLNTLASPLRQQQQHCCVRLSACPYCVPPSFGACEVWCPCASTFLSCPGVHRLGLFLWDCADRQTDTMPVLRASHPYTRASHVCIWGMLVASAAVQAILLCYSCCVCCVPYLGRWVLPCHEQ